MLTRVLDGKNAHFPVNSSLCNWRFCWSSCLASAVEMLACPRGWMTTRSHLSSGVLIFCFIIGNKQILQLSCPMLSRCKRLKLALGFWSNEIQNTKKYSPKKNHTKNLSTWKPLIACMVKNQNLRLRRLNIFYVSHLNQYVCCVRFDIKVWNFLSLSEYNWFLLHTWKNTRFLIKFASLYFVLDSFWKW